MSTMTKVPVLLRAAVGVKLTLIVQFAPTARVVGQALVWVKSPRVTIPLMVRGSAPLLVSVTGLGELAVPMFWLAKVRLAGDSVTAGAIPVPVKLMV